MAKTTAQGAMSSATSGYAPEEMQYQLPHFILLTVFSGFATIAVGLRFWARRIQTQALALHDYLILLGLVSVFEVSRAESHPLMMNNDRSLRSPRLVSMYMVIMLSRSTASQDRAHSLTIARLLLLSPTEGGLRIRSTRPPGKASPIIDEPI